MAASPGGAVDLHKQGNGGKRSLTILLTSIFSPGCFGPLYNSFFKHIFYTLIKDPEGMSCLLSPLGNYILIPGSWRFLYSLSLLNPTKNGHFDNHRQKGSFDPPTPTLTKNSRMGATEIAQWLGHLPWMLLTRFNLQHHKGSHEHRQEWSMSITRCGPETNQKNSSVLRLLR